MNHKGKNQLIVVSILLRLPLMLTPIINCGLDNIHPKFPNSSPQNRVLEMCGENIFIQKLQFILVGSCKNSNICWLNSQNM